MVGGENTESQRPGAEAVLSSARAVMIYVGGLSLLAGLYLAAAKMSFALAFTNTSIAPVWLPSGLAVAAVVVFGPRLALGVLIGAFAFNALTPVPLGVAGLIAVGNAAEAMCAGLLLRRAGFRPRVDRVRDVLALVGSGLLATVVSAAVGVTSLYLGGVVPMSAVPSSALLWWSGDAVGVLTLTPALLLAYTSRRRLRHVGRGRLVEAGLLAGALVLAWLTFIASILGPIVVFPPLVWAAIRFRLAGACLASLATSAVVVGATTRGVGLFASQPPGQDLLLAQGYVAVVVATSLLMAAMMAERERTTDELQLAAVEIIRRNDELEREGARLDEAQRIAHLGSWQWDISTDSVQWSDEMFRIYGLAPRSVALDYRDFLDRIHSEDRAEVDAVVRSACAAAGPFLVEHRILRPDGQVRTLQARGLAVSDGDAVARMAGTGLDITERREAERARQAACRRWSTGCPRSCGRPTPGPGSSRSSPTGRRSCLATRSSSG